MPARQWERHEVRTARKCHFTLESLPLSVHKVVRPCPRRTFQVTSTQALCLSLLYERRQSQFPVQCIPDLLSEYAHRGISSEWHQTPTIKDLTMNAPSSKRTCHGRQSNSAQSLWGFLMQQHVLSLCPSRRSAISEISGNKLVPKTEPSSAEYHRLEQTNCHSTAVRSHLTLRTYRRDARKVL